VLIQGTTIPLVARWLRLNAPEPVPAAPSLREHVAEHLWEIQLAPGAAAAGKRIIDLHLPRDVLLVLIERDGAHIVPTGSTELLTGDSILLATHHDQDPGQIKQLLQ
jgi:cell volume regulation protein A